MAQHKTITIEVVYDDAHPVPRDNDLRRSISCAVALGLLNDAKEESVIEEWNVDISSTPKLTRALGVREVLVSPNVLREAADNARALENDEPIYRLVHGVEETESGPPMEKGWLVRIIDFDTEMVTIESLDPHEDSGNGEGDSEMLQSVVRVSRKDIEEV